MLPTAIQTPSARARFISEPRGNGSTVPDRERGVSPRVRRYDSTQRVHTSQEYAEVKERGVAVRGMHCLLLVLAKCCGGLREVLDEVGGRLRFPLAAPDSGWRSAAARRPRRPYGQCSLLKIASLLPPRMSECPRDCRYRTRPCRG